MRILKSISRLCFSRPKQPAIINHLNFSTIKNNPSAERNCEPILNVLDIYLDKERPNLKLLEISSGTGQHAAHFARHFPNITFQPSEFDVSMLASINGYRENYPTNNICPSMMIDIQTPYYDWGKNPADHGPYMDGQSHKDFKDCVNHFDYMLNINMMHITPFECTEGLFRNASALLKVDGLLITYGPYAINGVISPASNVEFHKFLRSRDQRWGLRDIEQLKKICLHFDIEFQEKIQMPANNFVCIWKKIC